MMSKTIALPPPDRLRTRRIGIGLPAAVAGVLACGVATAQPEARPVPAETALTGTFQLAAEAARAADVDGLLRIGPLGDGRYAVDLRVVPRAAGGDGCVVYGIAESVGVTDQAVIVDLAAEESSGGGLFGDILGDVSGRASITADPAGGHVTVDVADGREPPLCTRAGLADGRWPRALDGLPLMPGDIADLTIMLRDNGHLPFAFSEPDMRAIMAALATFAAEEGVSEGASPMVKAIVLRTTWRDRYWQGSLASPDRAPEPQD